MFDSFDVKLVLLLLAFLKDLLVGAYFVYVLSLSSEIRHFSCQKCVFYNIYDTYLLPAIVSLTVQDEHFEFLRFLKPKIIG